MFANFFVKEGALAEWSISSILGYVLFLLEDFVAWSISWVLRGVNLATDWLAKSAIKGMCHIRLAP